MKHPRTVKTHPSRPVVRLCLADGSVLTGRGFGASVPAGGELVFNTALTGYTESLTDPSFTGQILVFTNPLIGNYGFETHRMESAGIRAAGVVISELSPVQTNPRAKMTLGEALRRAGVPGIEGVDTRALTELLRDRGSQNGLIAPAGMPATRRRKLLDGVPDMNGLDLSDRVTTDVPVWHVPGKKNGLVVALMDFGVKQNIIRELLNLGVCVRQLPARTTSQEILESSVDGVLLSNGPGDPASMTEVVANIRPLIGAVPVFGICLGHQLLALAAGLTTYKLKFGHRGTNHPVKDARDGRIAITSQNHGFAVRPLRTTARGVRITHVSLYDGTVEGLELPGRDAFAVQYHPEATPGPRDSVELFEHFARMCGAGRSMSRISRRVKKGR